MNDFTKEELQIILLDMDTYVEWTSSLKESDNHRELRYKLQSMIDNYCEHSKDVWPLYTANGDLPCAGICYECNNSVDRRHINE